MLYGEVVAKFKQALAINNELHDFLDEKIKIAFEKWTSCQSKVFQAKGTHWGYGHPSDAAVIDKWEYLVDGTILIEWSETWAFQGHDNGSETIPLDYILNEFNEQGIHDINTNEECRIAREIKIAQDKYKAEQELKIAQDKIEELKKLQNN